jgi:hypothetical protein
MDGKIMNGVAPTAYIIPLSGCSNNKMNAVLAAAWLKKN